MSWVCSDDANDGQKECISEETPQKVIIVQKRWEQEVKSIDLWT